MKEVLDLLFPPGIRPLARWRLTVFAVLVLMVVHILWACGWLGVFGTSGFAYASDVTRVTEEVSGIKLELLEQRLFETRVRQCKALEQPTKESREFYAQKVLELRNKYFALKRSNYEMPDCKEL